MTFELRSVRQYEGSYTRHNGLCTSDSANQKLEWSKGALSQHRTFNIQRCGSEKQL